MKNSLFLGRIAGIKIFVHWTFPIIIFWIIISNLSRGFSPGQLAWSVIFTLAIFICVFLHELGHALAARKYHIQTKDITLLPIGGVARLERMPDKPLQELIVALAGPAVNLAIVLVLFIVLNLTRMPADLSVITHVDANNFLLSLAIINLWLALFNLIPAFPMDGGRVLRALLSLRLKRTLATQIAGRIGQVLAFVFMFVGFFNNPFLIFIGLFVFLGAMAEVEHVKMQSILQGITVKDVTMKDLHVLNRKDTIAKAIELMLSGQAKKFLVMDGDKLYGTLGKDGIIKALTNHTTEEFVEVIADNNPAYIEVDEPIENALLMMQNHQYPMLIVTRNNKLYGFTDIENIQEYLQVIRASTSSQDNSD